MGNSLAFRSKFKRTWVFVIIMMFSREAKLGALAGSVYNFVYYLKMSTGHGRPLLAMVQGHKQLTV